MLFDGSPRAAFSSVAVALMLVGCAEAPLHSKADQPRLEVPSPHLDLELASATAGRAPKAPPADVSAPSPAAPLEALPVEGYLPAVVAPPDDALGFAPIVVAMHGAGGSPEPHCNRYRELTERKAFILCPRGRATNTHLPPSERGYFYDGHIELGREVIRALASLAEHYEGHVDLRDITFAGFSQGASMGILFLQQGGARDAHVRRILLVEGGADEWNIAVAKKLAEDGVEKVAIVCGQVSCHEGATHSLVWIQRAGLEVLSLYANGAGHTDEGAVRPLVDQAWAWMH